MELVLTSQDLEPLPIVRKQTKHVRPIGLLNSNYKNIVRQNFNNNNSNSIFGIRQRLKSRQYQITSGIGAILKLSVFVAGLVFFF